MPTISQAALPLNLEWTQGSPVDLTGILVGKAAWAGAATIDCDNTTIELIAVTLTVDNSDALLHLTLSAVNSALIPTGEYDYRLVAASGLVLAAGRIVVLEGTTTSWSAAPNLTLITPSEVFDWMGTPAGPSRNADQMQKVINAVASRISRGWTPPAVQPDDDWTLAHTMQVARIWKRKASPEGIIDSGEFGPIRVTRIDTDIADMLADFSKGPWEQ